MPILQGKYRILSVQNRFRSIHFECFSVRNEIRLHEMKRSWFDVPMQTIRCQLIDYDGPANGNEADLEEMLKLINNKYEAVIEVSFELKPVSNILTIFYSSESV